MFEVLLLAVLIGSYIFSVLLWISSWGKRWSRQAQKLGFTDVEISGLLWSVVRGRRKGINLAVRMNMINPNKTFGTSIHMDAPGLLPERLELRAESFLTQIAKIKEGPDIEVGDTNFDDDVLVRGHPVLALALLGAKNRQRILDLVRRGCQISKSRLIMRIDHLLRDDEFTTEISKLTNLVGALSDPKNPADLLARNALKDPMAPVRRRNLDMLVARFRHHNSTTDVLRSALKDKSPEVRVKAATALGDEGNQVLENLLADPHVADEIKADAIVGLGKRLSVERTIKILGDALRRRQRPQAFAAIDVLGVIGSTPAVQRLATMLGAGDNGFATSAAHALGNTGDPAATEALVNALNNPSRPVQLSVINALSRVANTTAVLPLRSFIHTHFIDRELRSLATKAVAAIHERISGAAAGQISLTEVDEGQLALAEDQNGKLSLT